MSPNDVTGLIAIISTAVLTLITVYRNYNRVMSIVRRMLGQIDAATSLDEARPKPRPTLHSLSERIDTLEKELKVAQDEKREEREDKIAAIDERDKAREEVGILRADYQKKITELQTQINSLQQQIDELNKQIAHQNQRNIDIAKERDLAREEITRLLREAKDDKQTILQMSQELNDLEIQVEALQIDNKAHKSLDILVDEFGKRLVPALVMAFRDAIRSTGENKTIAPESAP